MSEELDAARAALDLQDIAIRSFKADNTTLTGERNAALRVNMDLMNQVATLRERAALADEWMNHLTEDHDGEGGTGLCDFVDEWAARYDALAATSPAVEKEA